jgi:hypothetical protein
MKYLYLAAILAGLGIVVYYYGFNFDNMSEEMLVSSVLYWYVPLTFGLYGLAAYRVRNSAEDNQGNALKRIFSGKDTKLTAIGVILLAISGIFGFLFFMIPLLIFKTKSKLYDFLVAFFGAALWLGGLWVFFFLLWNSL